jgi:hypothetical protein
LYIGAERDIKVRIGKARSAFIRLGNIWKITAFSKKTKLKLYNSYVLYVLLYGSECWSITDRQQQTLVVFGLPLFLFPSGVRLRATFVMSSDGLRRT